MSKTITPSSKYVVTALFKSRSTGDRAAEITYHRSLVAANRHMKGYYTKAGYVKSFLVVGLSIHPIVRVSQEVFDEIGRAHV